MKFGTFFKPTPIYKEYLLLSMIAKNPHVTQRDIASNLQISVAMVNLYIDNFEEQGLLKRSYSSIKNVSYIITEKGENKIKILNIQYLESSLAVYNEAKNGCNIFFYKIINKGFNKVLFYGAGEIAEIMLSILNDVNYSFYVLAIIDDDEEKQGNTLIGKNIISIKDINNFEYDGICISTYNNAKQMKDNLSINGIDPDKIVLFFGDNG